MQALIVEDDKEIANLLAYLLQELGFEIRAASSGRQALSLLSAQPADLALVDLYIPDLDGLAVVKTVRADRKHDGLKIMMVTSAVDSAIVKKALDMGADEYLMKPFTKEMVRAKLKILGLLKS